eukprot:4312958-Pleurochrysis_carterae.AAC.3
MQNRSACRGVVRTSCKVSLQSSLSLRSLSLPTASDLPFPPLLPLLARSRAPSPLSGRDAPPTTGHARLSTPRFAIATYHGAEDDARSVFATSVF